MRVAVCDAPADVVILLIINERFCLSHIPVIRTVVATVGYSHRLDGHVDRVQRGWFDMPGMVHKEIGVLWITTPGAGCGATGVSDVCSMTRSILRKQEVFWPGNLIREVSRATKIREKNGGMPCSAWQ